MIVAQDCPFLSVISFGKRIITMSCNAAKHSSATLPQKEEDKVTCAEVKGLEKRKLADASAENVRTRTKKVKIDTRIMKKLRPGFDDTRYDETSYYFENGLRKVYPYYYTFTAFCKGRWVGRKLMDIYADEFRAQPASEFRKGIISGRITVNLKTVAVDYVLKDHDMIMNRIHRHEVPVTGRPIKIIHQSDDIVVVNKPSSIPVHPVGRYRHNSVVFILAKEYGLKNLKTMHRIDRLTSGVLLLAKSQETARRIEDLICERKVQKEYVCRVVGQFPTNRVVCEQPIEIISYKIGVCKVSPEKGKSCKTEFDRISYNGKSSVVLCRPTAGRMHQIRVHLQFLGFPILNDPIYNHEAFGKDRAKGGLADGSEEKLIQELITSHNMETWLNEESESFVTPDGLDPSSDSDSNNLTVKDEETSLAVDSDIPKELRFDSKKVTFDADCNICVNAVKFRDPSPKDLVMFLHARSYEGEDWKYESELPDWADENWKED